MGKIAIGKIGGLVRKIEMFAIQGRNLYGARKWAPVILEHLPL